MTTIVGYRILSVLNQKCYERGEKTIQLFKSCVSKERNLVSLYEDYAIFRFDRKPVGYILLKHWWFIKLRVCGVVFRGTVALILILLRSWFDMRLQPPRSTLFYVVRLTLTKFGLQFYLRVFIYITSNENTLKITGKIKKMQFTT